MLNINSMIARTAFNNANKDYQKAAERLTSGLRINSAKDDASGMAVSNRMLAQIEGMEVGVRNANDGISLLQVAESGITTMYGTLDKMRELAVKASSGTLADSDRTALDTEFQQLNEELVRIADSTNFNGIKMLSADAGAISIQIGADNDANHRIDINTTDMSTVNSALTDITTAANAQSMIDEIDTAMDTLAEELSSFGAYQNRFESAIDNLNVMIENQTLARDRIVSADMAKESTNKVNAEVLQQASAMMIGQANANAQLVLQLLR